MTRAPLTILCAEDEVWEGGIHAATLSDGRRLAVYKVGGSCFVSEDTCTHGKASLSEEGLMDGYFVECTWHSGRFDVRTGEACAMPCEKSLKVWPVQIIDGRVNVQLDSE